ncbi:Mitochondrial inner membrane organizing system component [Tilletia horrida]|nr:Mitochondrial inner membrane organizing system component [Tilletia horrida]
MAADNSSSASSSGVAPPKVPSEDIISQKTDLCISNTIVKTGLGFSAGVIASVLLFRRRAFPVWIGTGFGLGSGYTDCERSFNPISVPGVRIVPASSSSSSSSSSSPSELPAPSSFERLQQRAGEALGAAREKADQQLSKSGGLLEKLEAQGKQGLDAVKEQVGIASDKVKQGAAKVEEKTDEPYKDCLTCRLTGAAALTVTGTGALIEARRLGAFGPVPASPPSTASLWPLSSSASSLAKGARRNGKAWPRSLVGIGILCYAGALGRLFY